MKRITSIIFVLFAFSLFSYADFETGNDILSMYNPNPSDSTEFFNHGCCLGCIIGVHDAFEGIVFSSPQMATKGQVIDVAIKYLKDHPESRHMPASLLILRAFEEAFPLKKEKDKKGR